MAPSRRNSNGRSPLVNPQRQITSFFTKSTSPSPSSTLSKTNHKLNPNNISHTNPNPSSPTPLTPSPLNPKAQRNKPVLVIGASSCSPTPRSHYGEEVVGRRIKVYWPLDKAWYEGSVKSFDSVASKHVVCYDDDEEESLDLSKEDIEWIDDSSLKKFKRLRRASGVPVVRKMVIDDDDGEGEEECTKKEETVDDDDNDNGDDSNDEDWGKDAVLEDAADGEEDTDLEDEDDVAESGKGKKVEPKKRKLSGTEKQEPVKRSKSGVNVVKGAFKLSLLEPTNNSESK